ncbi:hypothetical protein B0H10DRAFT_2039599 [Mycena sp. CBHHK59/15]|nr:hypothetical protein B0H10DRAFT_2039599 [Mycena sp. CBHHK59/15]
MTEYDYSEEGYRRFQETQHRIANWADDTDHSMLSTTHKGSARPPRRRGSPSGPIRRATPSRRAPCPRRSAPTRMATRSSRRVTPFRRPA